MTENSMIGQGNDCIGLSYDVVEVVCMCLYPACHALIYKSTCTPAQGQVMYQGRPLNDIGLFCKCPVPSGPALPLAFPSLTSLINIIMLLSVVYLAHCLSIICAEPSSHSIIYE